MVAMVGSVFAVLACIVAVAVMGWQLLTALEDFIAEDDGAS